MHTHTQIHITEKRQKDTQARTETELLTEGTRETPCAGIKQQNPISCHYCSVIRSIWTLPWPSTTCLKHSQHLTSQSASNWSQTHFTSGHIDGYWARVLFSSPEILNYTLAMCSYVHRHAGIAATSELPLPGLAKPGSDSNSKTWHTWAKQCQPECKFYLKINEEAIFTNF